MRPRPLDWSSLRVATVAPSNASLTQRSSLKHLPGLTATLQHSLFRCCLDDAADCISPVFANVLYLYGWAVPSSSRLPRCLWSETRRDTQIQLYIYAHSVTDGTFLELEPLCSYSFTQEAEVWGLQNNAAASKSTIIHKASNIKDIVFMIFTKISK